MDPLFHSKKPLISSQLSANKRSQLWLEQMQTQTKPYDGDGLRWQLQVEHLQKPHKEDPKKLIWTITFRFTASASKSELLQTGTLNLPTDERLLSLLPETQAALFALDPVVVSSYDEQEVIKAARKKISDYITYLQSHSLHTFKRKIITNSITKRRSFAEPI